MYGEALELCRAEVRIVQRRPGRTAVYRFPDTTVTSKIDRVRAARSHGDGVSVDVQPGGSARKTSAPVCRTAECERRRAAQINLRRIGRVGRDRLVVPALPIAE